MRHPDDRPLRKDDPQLYCLIGEIVCRGADVDLMLFMLYAHLADVVGVDKATVDKARGTSTSNICDRLREVDVLEQRLPTITARLPGFLQEVQYEMDKRHHVVHGIWWSFGEIDVSTRIRRGGKVDGVVFTVNRLKALVTRLNQLHMEGVSMFYAVTGIDPLTYGLANEREAPDPA